MIQKGRVSSSLQIAPGIGICMPIVIYQIDFFVIFKQFEFMEACTLPPVEGSNVRGSKDAMDQVAQSVWARRTTEALRAAARRLSRGGYQISLRVAGCMGLTLWSSLVDTEK